MKFNEKFTEKDRGQVVLYKNKLEVKLEKETVWLAQKDIADLFDAERSVITKHIRNILKTKELAKGSVCANFAHTAEDGKVYQTFNGKDVYPTIEEKAAHLLYFVTKNHSFVDGNKRIAAALFICFLQRNALLLCKDGSRRIDDTALVALTLMTAASKPAEKDTMIKVIRNLLA